MPICHHLKMFTWQIKTDLLMKKGRFLWNW